MVMALKFKKTLDEEIIDMDYLVEDLNERFEDLIFEMKGDELSIQIDDLAFYGEVKKWKQ